MSKTHVLYMELFAKPEGAPDRRVDFAVWDRFLARRVHADSGTASFQVYPRIDAAGARNILHNQVDSFIQSGFRIRVAPVLAELAAAGVKDTGLEKKVLSPELRLFLDELSRVNAVSYEDAAQ